MYVLTFPDYVRAVDEVLVALQDLQQYQGVEYEQRLLALKEEWPHMNRTIANSGADKLRDLEDASSVRQTLIDSFDDVMPLMLLYAALGIDVRDKTHNVAFEGEAYDTVSNFCLAFLKTRREISRHLNK